MKTPVHPLKKPIVQLAVRVFFKKAQPNLFIWFYNEVHSFFVGVFLCEWRLVEVKVMRLSKLGGFLVARWKPVLLKSKNAE